MVQSGLLFVAGLLSVPGSRHVGAQDYDWVIGILHNGYAVNCLRPSM